MAHRSKLLWGFFFFFFFLIFFNFWVWNGDGGFEDLWWLGTEDAWIAGLRFGFGVASVNRELCSGLSAMGWWLPTWWLRFWYGICGFGLSLVAMVFVMNFGFFLFDCGYGLKVCDWLFELVVGLKVFWLWAWGVRWI
jgi:hypothetical protein